MATLFSISMLISVLRGATPLVFASLGGLLSERSGIIQIGLEGMMLMGALLGAVGGHYFSSPWLGFLSGTLAGAATAAIFGLFALVLKTDQIITGTAINLLALGLAPFITKILFNSTGSTPGLPLEQRFTFEPIVMALVMALAVAYILNQTKTGLLFKFAGEEPLALKAAGYSVALVRWGSLISAGALAGMGGASLSLFLASNYSPHMTAGRGFMSLAALIFGKWKPLPTLGACLFFALTEAIQIRLQGVTTGIPVQWIQILPYVVTIVALAGFFGQSRAPKALGQHVE